jgi:hypothetical protein
VGSASHYASAWGSPSCFAFFAIFALFVIQVLPRLQFGGLKTGGNCDKLNVTLSSQAQAGILQRGHRPRQW